MKHKIFVVPHNITIYATDGQDLLSALTENGIPINADCAGRGRCGKCKIQLIAGEVTGALPDENGLIRSCRASVNTDITVAVNPLQHSSAASDCDQAVGESKSDLGVVLDIGTTTLAAALVDLKTARVLKHCSRLNPQSACGADVLSRIEAYGKGKGELLRKLILDAVRDVLKTLCGYDPPREITVAANTAMLHIFFGVDPTPLGIYPFTPVFTDIITARGEELGLNADNITLLPSAGAYIGSDITAGILSLGMHISDETSLFCDIGTNGELVLAHKGKLYSASTAAGPALEGACIECGTGGIPGAINRFRMADGKLIFDTVDDLPACGICGSGLTDLIAILITERLIDKSGKWNRVASSPLMARLLGERFYITGNVYISQADIRQFQLAKSAILTGIETLLYECGVTPGEIETVYLAGSLGFYLDIHNTVLTGILPPVLESKAHAVGNTALAGAQICLTVPAKREEIKRISEDIQGVELALSEYFGKAYINNLTFR